MESKAFEAYFDPDEYDPNQPRFKTDLLPPPTWTGTYEILLGPEGAQHRFLAHSALLVELTEYFKALLRESGDPGQWWAEAANNRVILDQLHEGVDFGDDAEIFSIFLWALYRKRLSLSDLWYDIDETQIPEEEIREETFVRLMRVYLLGDYFRSKVVRDLAEDRMFFPSDGLDDWFGVRVPIDVINLAWGWLEDWDFLGNKRRHRVKQRILDDWYECTAQEYEQVADQFSQGFVDDWLGLMFEKGD